MSVKIFKNPKTLQIKLEIKVSEDAGYRSINTSQLDFYNQQQQKFFKGYQSEK